MMDTEFAATEVSKICVRGRKLSKLDEKPQGIKSQRQTKGNNKMEMEAGGQTLCRGLCSR